MERKGRACQVFGSRGIKVNLPMGPAQIPASVQPLVCTGEHTSLLQLDHPTAASLPCLRACSQRLWVTTLPPKPACCECDVLPRSRTPDFCL